MIQIVNSEKMQWESGYKKVFPDAEWVSNPTDQADVHIFMWCNKTTVDFINTNTKRSIYIVFVRRYEYYNSWIEQIDWKKVDAVITVNDFIACGFEQRTNIKPYIIYNGVSLDKWKFKERKHGKKIAVVGFINQKKNLPLAMQILTKLPKEYELHLAGEIQDGATIDYISHIANTVGRKIYIYNHIPSEHINSWLEDKNYILSTAISEGCPNNVLEAMAKGIKPIVHNWAGAKEQFGNYVFNTIDEAVSMINSNNSYNSSEYREVVENKFSWNNFIKVKEIIANV